MKKYFDHIAVLSIYSFPYGSAATTRILAYSKGLIANELSVDVIIVSPTDTPNGEKLADEGKFEGINYYYPSGRYKSKYKILRGISVVLKIRKILGYFHTWKKVQDLNYKKNYQTIIISTDQIIFLLIFSFLSKKVGAKAIFIFDEYPTPIRHKLKNKIPFWKEYLYRKTLKFLDGYVSISENLKNYYNSFVKKPSCVIPVITDVSRFLNFEFKDLHNQKHYLCYMGNMELSKDDIDNLIKSFSLIADEYNEIELHLYGTPSKETIIYLKGLIDDLYLANRIQLKGRIPNWEVPRVLSNATILVSSQPRTLRASGGFPTKLGEYLAAGVPSILTDVGENSKYVQNGIHVFLVPPKDPQKYAEKIKYVLDHYDDAKKIALEGKKFLFDNYSHVIQGKKLSEFIRKLNSGSISGII